jgi:hypothetical protein
MDFEERAADPLAGGIMRGYQCGMIWGATLAAGAQTYRTLGKGPQAEARAIIAAQGIVESFRAQNKSANCREITGIDMASVTPWRVARFLIKSAPTGSCFGMAARYAKTAFTEISTAISAGTSSAKHIESLPAPTSCAAMLAQKMDASDFHTVMAAGFAGGIGLSGGACGALGAAIWLIGMGLLKKGDKFAFQAQHALDAIEKFTKYTDHEFECSKIVGRKFEGIQDHASYLREGGCAEILEALATV